MVDSTFGHMGAPNKQALVCNSEILPPAIWGKIDKRLFSRVHNVGQEAPIRGEPPGVCHHHTERKDTERMPQFIRGRRKR